MSLELYFFNECPFCQRVTQKIEQLSIHSIEMRNIRENDSYKQKLLADTGRLTVPCLYIDGKPMHESEDIMNWLEANQESIK